MTSTLARIFRRAGAPGRRLPVTRPGNRAAAALLMVLASGAVFDAYPARVERASFQSDHFEYLIDSSKTADLPYLSAQFESAYRRLTDHFDFRPDMRMKVLFLDEDDYSNGYAFGAQGWIVIFLPPADFDLRGKTAWLPNVIAHELAHIITLRKMGETSRFLGYQVLGDLAFRRKGALHADLTVRRYNTPAWFAEGIAQHGSQVCGYDTTDGFRRMILETARESGDLLSLPEMSAFGWDGRRNEMIYTQGYFLTGYLYGRFGREKMNQVLAATVHGGFEAAFGKVLSRSPEALYGDWRQHIDSAAANRPESPPSDPATPRGKGPYVRQASPVRAPDGSLAYLSSERNDYGVTDLYVRKDGVARLVRRQADGPLNLSPDGRLLYFTRLTASWKTGGLVRDLYQYDFAARRERRLTWGARVTAGAPDSSGTVYFLSEHGGRTRLSRMEEAGPAAIAEYPIHVKLSGLAPGDRAGYLLAEIATGRGSDIYAVEASTGTLTPLLATAGDERNPRWDPAGGRLLFSADYTGTYQVYSLRNDSLAQLTRGGPDRLDPMAQGGALFSRIYARRGFVLDSLPMGGLEPLGLPRDSVLPNRPFSPPEPTRTDRKSWGDDGMKYLGYSVFARLARTPGQEDLFGIRDRDSELYRVEDPGGYYRWTTGGAGIWMHPGEESMLYIQAGLSNELGEAGYGNPYLSEASAYYSNRSLGPTVNGAFESITRRIPPAESLETTFDFTLLRFILSLDWRLNNHLYLTGFGNYSGISIKSGDGLRTGFSGGGAMFGNVLQFVVHQPGVDFPNQLLALQSGIGYAPGFGIQETWANWNALTLATHSRRRAYYQASVAGTTIMDDDVHADFSCDARLSLDFRPSVRVPVPGSRGLFLANVFPAIGVGYASDADPQGSSGPGISPFAAPGPGRNHSLPGPNGPAALRGAAALQNEPLAFLEKGRLDMLFSTTLKLVSPLNTVVYWNFYYAFPIPGEFQDGYFGVGLSL